MRFHSLFASLLLFLGLAAALPPAMPHLAQADDRAAAPATQVEKPSGYEKWAQQIEWGDAATRNPFFDNSPASFTRMELQREALLILKEANVKADSGRAAAMVADIRKIAAQKLPYFNETPKSAATARLFEKLTPEQRTQAALEYILTTFTSTDFDLPFRQATLGLLRVSEASDLKTVELLMPLTRGVFWVGDGPQLQARELVDANGAIEEITRRSGHNYVSAKVATDHQTGSDVDAFARSIANSKQTRVKQLGGGVNDTLKVTLVQPDGTEVDAIFKSLKGSRPVADLFYQANPREFRKFVLPVREARASNFYHLLLDRYRQFGGKVDIQVPPTVEGVLVKDGNSWGVGSFQKFLSGYEDLSAFQWKHHRDWEILRHTQEWQEAEAVIRTADYVYGNSDRFRKKPGETIDKNVMIKVTAEDTPHGRVVKLESVRLIDNGLGLPGHPDYDINLMPVREHIPDPMKKALASFSGEELAALAERESAFLPPVAIEDFVHRFQQAAIKATGGPCNVVHFVQHALRPLAEAR